jgi:ribonuclease HI
MTIIAAADGSALGNPGPMGWAWYIDDSSWAAGGAPHGTNNIGELTAVLELLRATAHTGDDLLVHCDSRYVIDSITKWMPGWKKKGWKKADGKPVLNLEIMKALDEAMQGRRVRFEWVKGHAGHPLNEAADARANGAAQAYQKGAPVQSGPGFAGSPTQDPVAPATPPAQPRPTFSDAEPTLFDAFDDDPTVHLTISLPQSELDALRARARKSGVSVDEFLRGLV